MNIDPKGTIANFPSTAVRSLFLHHQRWFMSFTERSVGHHLEISEADARTLLRELERLGYLQEVKNQQWSMTDEGTRLAQASAAPRITRKTANRLMQELLARCRVINRSAVEYAFCVKRLIVFGSYCTDAPTLGDIDLAVELRPRVFGPVQQQAFEDEIRQRHPYDGNLIARLERPETNVRKFLKNRSGYLSVANLAEVEHVLKKPQVPQKTVFNEREGGDLTIEVPAEWCSVKQDRIDYRLGYGNGFDCPKLQLQDLPSPAYQSGQEAGMAANQPKSDRNLPLKTIKILTISPALDFVAELPGFQKVCSVWHLPIGQVGLLLLETNIPVKRIQKEIQILGVKAYGIETHGETPPLIELSWKAPFCNEEGIGWNATLHHPLWLLTQRGAEAAVSAIAQTWKSKIENKKSYQVWSASSREFERFKRNSELGGKISLKLWLYCVTNNDTDQDEFNLSLDVLKLVPKE